jgi:hypothetical protein
MRAWLRKNWSLSAGLAALLIGVAALNATIQPSSFLRGLVDGVAVAGFASVVLVVSAVASGSWPRLWGAAGETSTAEEFTRRRRVRQGWRIFHGLNIGGHDIDHVAVGPGGVLAIETKFVASGTWRVTANGSLAGPLCEPLKQARISAWKTSSFLGSTTGGRLDLDVAAVLIVWGPGCPELRDGHEQLEGVDVFSGRYQRTWRAWLDDARLSDEVRRQVVQSFATYAPLNHAEVEKRSSLDRNCATAYRAPEIRS